MPGDQLGPYNILTTLGASATREVYEARDTRLDRLVAIRVLPDYSATRGTRYLVMENL